MVDQPQDDQEGISPDQSQEAGCERLDRQFDELLEKLGLAEMSQTERARRLIATLPADADPALVGLVGGLAKAVEEAEGLHGPLQEIIEQSRRAGSYPAVFLDDGKWKTLLRRETQPFAYLRGMSQHLNALARRLASWAAEIYINGFIHQLVSTESQDYESKKSIAKRVNDLIRRHGSEIVHPDKIPPEPCTLIVITTVDGEGRYSLQSKEANKRSKATKRIEGLLPLMLQPESPRKVSPGRPGKKTEDD